VVNDDVALALRYPTVGLHVGQEDTPALLAREMLGQERVIGLSTHSMAQAKEAIALGSTLSYFAVGPVFSTATKPDYVPVGLQLVRSVAALDSPTPFFCIGGITRSNVGLVKENGARRVVAVSDVLCAADSSSAIATFQSALK
jgi:thiamine-phosphate pyrophosphorylase